MENREKWIFFGVAYTLCVLEFGFVFSFGALLPLLLETFSTDRFTASLVQSLLIGVTSCFCVVSGILINKFGFHVVVLLSSVLVSTGFSVSFFSTDIWYLYVTVSIMAGTGISMIHVTSITLVSKIFDGKQRPFCLAMLGTVVPFAGIFYPYFLELVSTKYGLNGTLLLIGGIFSNSYVFFVMLWFRRNVLTQEIERDTGYENVERMATHNSRTMNLSLMFKEIATGRIICLLLSTSIVLSSLNGFLSFAFDIAKWKGFQNAEVNLLFVIHNIASCILSLVQGIIRQLIEIDLYLYPIGFAILATAGGLSLLLGEKFAVFAVGIALLGSVECILSSANIISVHLVCSQQIDVVVGTMQTSIGFLSIFIGPLFGTIRDNSGSYDGCFLILIGTQACSAILFVADFIIRNRKKKIKRRDCCHRTHRSTNVIKSCLNIDHKLCSL